MRAWGDAKNCGWAYCRVGEPLKFDSWVDFGWWFFFMSCGRIENGRVFFRRAKRLSEKRARGRSPRSRLMNRWMLGQAKIFAIGVPRESLLIAKTEMQQLRRRLRLALPLTISRWHCRMAWLICRRVCTDWKRHDCLPAGQRRLRGVHSGPFTQSHTRGRFSFRERCAHCFRCATFPRREGTGHQD
jgi:hypothetical protein